MTDDELVSFVQDFKSGILSGSPSNKMCFAICVPLQSYLSFLGIETELIKGDVIFPEETWEHFWLLLKDGRILDPSIDQFKQIKNAPSIYIGKLPKCYKAPNLQTLSKKHPSKTR